VDLPGAPMGKKGRNSGTLMSSCDSSTGELATKLSQLNMSDGGDKPVDAAASAHQGNEAVPSSSSAATAGPSSGGSCNRGNTAAVVSEEALIAALAAAGDEDSSLTIEQLISQQSEGFMVTPLSWCDHIEGAVGPVPDVGVDTSAPCVDCGSMQENWCCLQCYQVTSAVSSATSSCKEKCDEDCDIVDGKWRLTAQRCNDDHPVQVGCGRFVEGHLLKHGTAASHPLALSFSDLTVWCYVCEQYVHHKAFLEAKRQAYRSKFNEEMPVPESWRDQ
ncbi:Zinc finger UBP-type, partial [Trinorchestia longiramus]